MIAIGVALPRFSIVFDLGHILFQPFPRVFLVGEPVGIGEVRKPESDGLIGILACLSSGEPADCVLEHRVHLLVICRPAFAKWVACKGHVARLPALPKDC